MTSTATPSSSIAPQAAKVARPIATHVYRVPIVRELPRAPEPGAGALTW
jgi:hypothetical protein